ncbi:HpcH/HpaI aldolase/citrate lyase family protein [Alphaproteobacteria bacterium KMM 3653]|uniref:Hydroxypyruvate/pyruvate aldolase n=1 Tax=Harenicola maris TaxID=2841044 RepID=A0AAP2G6W7_9RHOB|nr:HpcH/HpaI aldolase/citrate lyase family protein [Harenicola maris]
MAAPVNAFKAAITRGEVQIGAWVGLVGVDAAEVSARAGFDWLLIDGEHAPNDLQSIIAQLRVVEGRGSQPIVRPVSGETWMIKQYLDAGAQTLLIPMVDSAEQAEALAAAMRYPPQGIRGVGAALARASHYGSLADYVTTANEQMCLLVQAESRAAHANLDAILGVEGVDGVFVGPADLGADMGFAGQDDAPQVRAAILDIITRTVAAGKAAGILTLDADLARECIALGATFVATAIDTLSFSQAMRDAATAGLALKP